LIFNNYSVVIPVGVIPAKAGIQIPVFTGMTLIVDPCFRRDDKRGEQLQFL